MLRSVADNSPPGMGKGWVSSCAAFSRPQPTPNPSQEREFVVSRSHLLRNISYK